MNSKDKKDTNKIVFHWRYVLEKSLIIINLIFDKYSQLVIDTIILPIFLSELSPIDTDLTDSDINVANLLKYFPEEISNF